MTAGRQKDCPLPEAAKTGWSFISPCCTAGVDEFLIDGEYWLCFSVAGHGWNATPWRGRVQDINDTGSICEPGKPERRVFWSQRRQDEQDAARAPAANTEPMEP